MQMISLQSYVHKGRSALRRWMLDPRLHRAGQAAVYLIAGFVLSAASLGSYSLPLAMGFVCACTGWPAVLAAAGGCLGYWLFWGTGSYIGLIWIGACLPVTLLIGSRSMFRKVSLLLPAVAGFFTAASGVACQFLFQDMTPIPIYLLRIALGAGSAMLFHKLLQGRNPILDWLATGLLVLSLAQINPIPYLGLGFLAAGFITGTGAFPAAVICGLALDLAQITPVPMTAVVSFSYLIRFLPRYPKWLAAMAPAVVYLGIMTLQGSWDITPVPALSLGGVIGIFLPLPGRFTYRRGETGVAQVRLEMAAGVLTQTQILLMETDTPPVDEEALMMRAAERACGGCAHRKNCRESQRIAQLPPMTLHKPLLSTEELPIICRKPGRFLAELHRCQEQLRSIRADRQRQREYRTAVIQQYRFLSSFLQELADQLPRRTETVGKQLHPEVTVYANRPEPDNGDRCLRFSGVGKKYYVLLCDGMGKGMGAVEEGKNAAALLQKMLRAGYPAEHALRSLNSLCALRDRAGAVTVDLVEIMLDSGKFTLYKWGAAPSYLATRYGAEQLGTVSPPPGISVSDQEERVEHGALRWGQSLVMVSDGINPWDALRCCSEYAECSPGELAAGILACGQIGGQDDATVVIVQLK